MKYRAELIDPGAKQERPQQILSNSWSDIQDWTDKRLQAAKSDDALVNHYETAERRIGFVPKPKKESPAK